MDLMWNVSQHQDTHWRGKVSQGNDAQTNEGHAEYECCLHTAPEVASGSSSHRLHLCQVFSNRCMDNGQELVGLQACSSNQNAIDTMLTKVRGCVFRFYAATVLNKHLLGSCLSTDLT